MDFINEVSLHELEFYYPNSKTPALRNITLRIPKGCMIGIIGTSGAGKSTLIGILTGLLECGEGQMTVDGFSVTGETSAAWRSNVAYVAQNPYLTDASIAENIAFSFWGMPLDRQKVLHCCRMAAINFIDNLPEGIDTPMGERGVRLSGGQLQRIAIARALYAEPKFLVFDEATSALDDFNETQIQNTINGLRGKQTLIIVAHRLTTVEQCDLVCWLENGELKQSGTPGEILPLFRAYSQQLENERVT
jgi:ABC-type bacteriocin/lantibiotic exporter with double-glycine peptidase domain